MKLTEQQRAYMFANWPKVSDTPWNKVDLNGPLASQLAAMKKLARAAHPTGGAAAAAGPTKTIAKKKAKPADAKYTKPLPPGLRKVLPPGVDAESYKQNMMWDLDGGDQMDQMPNVE